MALHFTRRETILVGKRCWHSLETGTTPCSASKSKDEAERGRGQQNRGLGTAPKTSGTSIRHPESSSSLGCNPAGAQSLLEGHLAHLGTWLLCCHGLKSPPIQGFGAGHSPREANCLCRARRDCSLVRSSFTVSSMWLALSELSAVTVCWGARGRHTRAAPWLGLVPARAPGSQGDRMGCNHPQILPGAPPVRFGIL